MSALSLPVLKKTDDTGVGVSRAAVLYKVIKEGTPIDLVSGGKKAIQAKSNEVLKALETAADTQDDSAHKKLSDLFLFPAGGHRPKKKQTNSSESFFIKFLPWGLKIKKMFKNLRKSRKRRTPLKT